MAKAGPTACVLLAYTLLTFPIVAFAQSAQHRVDDLRIRPADEQPGAVDVVVEGSSGTPRYTVRALGGGRRLLVEMEGSLLRGAEQMAAGSGAVTSARATASVVGVRIEIRLAEEATYRVRARGSSLRIRVAPANAAEEPSSSDGQSAADEQSEARPSPRAEAETASASAPGEAEGTIAVERVGFRGEDGRDQIVIEMSQATGFRLVPGTEGRRLELRSAELPEDLVRTYFPPRGRTRILRAVRAGVTGGRVFFEAQTVGEDTPAPTAIRRGTTIVWSFPTEVGVRPELAVRRGRTIQREPSAVETEADEVAAFLTDVPLQVRARGRRRYSGRRVDLDFREADIHNILRLLSEVGRVNIVTGDDVDGTVTIRMRNVPWDQALDVILQAKGLGMVRTGNVIRVAPLTTLEKEREMAIARRKQQVQLAPIETRLIPVSYATAEELSPRVRELLSARGSVSVDGRTNVMIVRDVAESLDDVEELVRSLDTQTPQVLIEARIVEATSTYLHDVGIQWGGDFSVGTATGNPTGLAFPSSISLAGGAYDSQTPTQGLSPFTDTVPVPNFAVNLPAAAGLGSGGVIGLSLGSIANTVNLGARLSAAEAEGTVRIISSPRILTLDNREAHIAQGTLIPYSQISAQGVQTAFQEAKLELNVRPHVTSDGSVAMHVKITRDEPDFNRTGARGDPTILKREAETDLLVPDGHTAVIGGIYTRNTGRDVSRVPFFGDIPILGVLFQRRRVRDDRNELLIFITPRIINRA
ncbi:MAG: type IV pilus secretin PilQ, partial [Deltaproteobacteria bacterium]|nr:type IV pilus secretin PilQ [Deltaproteobacteria bacterium]